MPPDETPRAPAVPFAELPWETLAPGARAKTHLLGPRKLRLVEFSAGFSEVDWCTREHLGLVLEGTLRVEFQQPAGTVAVFETGEGIAIPENTPHRHAGTVAREETIRLFLVEKA